MHKIFESNEIEAILLVDAENTFTPINWKAMQHNIKCKMLCPIFATFLYNCYDISSQFFIVGGN